jgi:peroxiredoxin
MFLRRAEKGIQSMAREDNLYGLPEGLPIPVDDGASDHLPSTRLPSVPLRSTAGNVVDLASLTGRTVVYCYPRISRPDEEMPQDWDEIPGARGCTPQSCAFRDHHAELRSLGARVFGLSAQGTEYQREAAQRLRLPFELLSDEELAFAKALGLPVFEAEGMTLLKRLTLVVNDGRIEKVFYPVFPPNENAKEVIEWLSQNPLEAVRTP